MKILLFPLVAGLMYFGHVDTGNAISRYNASALNCQQVTARISREGAAIVRYRSKRGTGVTLFDRFVKNTRYCQSDEIAKRKSIPVAGGRLCSLKYCKTRERFLKRRLYD